jgi:Tfp pilus assembly protein PilF
LKKWSAAVLSLKSNTYVSPYYIEFYRPLQMMTFVVDQHLADDKEPLAAFHRTEILLFIVSLVLLYCLLLRIGVQRLAAFLATMLFACHPLVTSSVVWLPARGDLLAADFALLTLHTFISIQKGKKLFAPLHFLFFFGALLSRETAVVIPIVLLIFDKVFLKNRLLTWKNAFLVMCWLGSVFVFSLMKSLGLMYENTDSVLTGWVAISKNLPLLPIAFSKMFLPFDMTTYAMFKPAAIMSGILCLVVMIILIFRDKNRRPIYVFGILWCAIFILPVLTVRFPLAEYGREYFECWIYLSGIGLAIMLGVVLQSIKNKQVFNLFVYACTTIIIVFGFAASSHAKDFANSETFANSAIRSYNNNSFAYVDRGEWRFNRGEYEAGIKDISRSIDICPDNDFALFTRARLYFYTRRYEDAKIDLVRTITLDPGYVEAYVYKGWVDFSENRYNDAIDDFTMVIKLRPDHGWGHYLRGKAYEALGDFENALDDYSIAAFMTDNDSRMAEDVRRMKEKLHRQKMEENSDSEN